MVDLEEFIKNSVIAEFAYDLSKKMNVETLSIHTLPSLDQLKTYPENSIVILENGVQQIIDNPNRTIDFRNLVVYMGKVICVEDHKTSLTLERVATVLRDLDLPLEFHGYGKDHLGRPRIISIFSRTFNKENKVPPENFKVIALIATYNERDVIDSVVQHLQQNAVDVYILDNWSTDGTYEKAAQLQEKGIIGLERFPVKKPTRYFELVEILKRKEELSQTLYGDWFFHCDADEIRESPWQELNLREAFYQVEQEGYNAVDFSILKFHPTDNSFQEGKSLTGQLRYCKFETPSSLHKISSWKKNNQPVDLHSKAGHDLTFEGRSVYPIKFLLRHYPIRSQQHGERKVFNERKTRWSPELKKNGWHVQYDQLVKGCNFIKSPRDLILFDDDFYQKYLFERLTGSGLEK